MSTLGKSRGVTFGTFFASRSLLIADICAITVFSYLGVFLRVIITSRLQSNTLSSEVPIVYRHFLYNSHFAPNLLGCFIIAILFNLKRNILALAPMALYTGMTTGFCGSLTTFSSWAYSIAQDMFSAGVSASIVLMIVHLALLQACLSLGLIFTELTTSLTGEANMLARVGSRIRRLCVRPSIGAPASERESNVEGGVNSSLEAPCALSSVETSCSHLCLGGRIDNTGGVPQASPSNHPPPLINPDEGVPDFDSSCAGEACCLLWLALLSTSAVWVVIIVWSYSGADQNGNERSELHRNVNIDMLRSIALAPFGTLLRYSLWHLPVASPYLEKTVPSLKAPTLLANVLGTLCFSLSARLKASTTVGLYAHAFREGFCGSLTTASTLVLELHLLRVGGGTGSGTGTGAWQSARYGLISFGGGVLIALVVLWAT